MIKLCVFDLDGLLVDSEVQMWRPNQIKILKRMGYQPDIEFLRSIVGSGTTNLIKLFKDFYGKSFDIDMYLREVYIENNISIANKEVPVKKGAFELLDYCKEKNLKISLGSSSKKPYVYNILESCDLKDYFDSIVTGDDVKEQKPSPDIYLKCLSYYDIEKNDAVIFEDAHNGLLAGNAAKTRVILVPGSGLLYDSDYNDAYKVIDSLDQAIELIEKENETTTCI